MLLWHWILVGIHCLHCKTCDHHIKNIPGASFYMAVEIWGTHWQLKKKQDMLKNPNLHSPCKTTCFPAADLAFLLSALRTRFHRPAQLLTLHWQRSASGGFLGWELRGNGREWHWKCGLKSGTLQHYDSHRNARPKPVCTSLLHGSARPRCSFSPGELNRP